SCDRRPTNSRTRTIPSRTGRTSALSVALHALECPGGDRKRAARRQGAKYQLADRARIAAVEKSSVGDHRFQKMRALAGHAVTQSRQRAADLAGFLSRRGCG